jgi:hypothetical protein
LATFHSFVNARYSDISIDCNDFDAGFLITLRKKSNFTLQKAMIFGQKMTMIIVPIENVSSTSGILSSGIFKEDLDDYPKFL